MTAPPETKAVSQSRGARSEAPSGSPQTPATRSLRLQRTADLTAPGAVRRGLNSWFGAMGLADITGLADDDRDDLVLAVDEAVANVVDHAYAQFDDPGDLVVNVEVGPHPDGGDCIVADVADRGRWRPCLSESGYRGRGLNLMRCCTDWVRIESSDAGTRVVMGTRPIRLT